MIRVIPLELTGSDERGYTCEYYHERLGHHIILFRKAGSTSGGNYHKGNSLTKDPEILMLLHGTCQLNWKDVGSSGLQMVMAEGPARIEIPAYCWHQLIAMTDCVLLELNSIADHAADTYYDE